MIETQAFPFEIKDLTATGEIVGLASVYGNTDRQGEAVAPGAFRASIERMAATGRGLPMLREHRAELACGSWTGFADTGGALRVSGRLAMGTEIGRETRALIAAGALTGLSIGFANATRTRANGRPVIVSGDLLEVSLVAIPANPAAVIESMKCAPSPREVEAALKAAGMSNRQAKAAAVAACKAIAAPHEDDEHAALAAIFEAARQRVAPYIKR
jgi:HK97 family phage prohead protease